MPVVHDGSVSITEAGDLEILQGVTHIEGGLTLYETEVASVSLPELRSVQEEFRFAWNGSLLDLQLPCLEDVGEQFYFGDNTAITAVSFPSLTRVNGDFVLAHNNYQMATADFSALESVSGSLDVANNDALLRVHMDSLRTVGGDFSLRNLEEGIDDVVIEASFAQLEEIGESLLVEEMRSLESIRLDALSLLGGDFRVLRNQVLPQCSVEFLLERLQGLGQASAEVQNEDNRLDCTCIEGSEGLEVNCGD